MMEVKKTLCTVLMLSTSLVVSAQEPQTNEDVSPELRILTPKENTAPLNTKNPQFPTLSGRYILYKDGKRYKLEFDIDYYDQSPALERAVAKYFFKDSVSNTLKDAFDSYLAQFSKESYVYTNFNSFVYKFSMSRSVKVGSLQNFFLSLQWEDYTGDAITKTKKQWNLVYDIDDDKILGIDDVFTPTEAQKIKDVIGNRRFQMIVFPLGLFYGYMQKGKLYKFSKRFKEVPEDFSDSFKEKVGKVRSRSFEDQNSIAEGGAVIKAKEVRSSDGEVLKAKEVISGDGNGVFDVVEQMPSFLGGTYEVETIDQEGRIHKTTKVCGPGQEGLRQWLSDNVKYPAVAEENGIQGRVIVSYVVEKDGSITDIRVVKSVDPSLDREAIRVVSSMPRWKPGMQKGEPVRVRYTVPVTFRLT